jgi:hypothetical protein
MKKILLLSLIVSAFAGSVQAATYNCEPFRNSQVTPQEAGVPMGFSLTFGRGPIVLTAERKTSGIVMYPWKRAKNSANAAYFDRYNSSNAGPVLIEKSAYTAPSHFIAKLQWESDEHGIMSWYGYYCH